MSWYSECESEPALGMGDTANTELTMSEVRPVIYPSQAKVRAELDDWSKALEAYALMQGYGAALELTRSSGRVC